MVSNRKALVLSLLILVLIPLWPPVQAQTNFIAETNLSSMNLFGSAAVIPNVGIRLTEQADFTKGRVVYPHRVRMKAPGSVDATFSFSTSFVFSIIPPPDPSKVGDGIAFIITPHAYQSTALAAQYLGLFDNFTSMGQSYNHLFALEFDTIKNEEFNDIDGNHVGVDVNSLVSADSTPSGYWIDNQFFDLDLKNGQNIQAWIDYNHFRKELNVTLAPAGSLRPKKPLISVVITSPNTPMPGTPTPSVLFCPLFCLFFFLWSAVLRKSRNISKRIKSSTPSKSRKRKTWSAVFKE